MSEAPDIDSEGNAMWAFEGTGNAIRFTEQQNGSLSIYGHLGSQYFRPTSGDVLGTHEINKVDSFFSAEDHPIDGVSRGLLTAFRARPTRSHAMIRYYPKEDGHPSIIAVTVILCEGSVERVFGMYKRLFGRADHRPGARTTGSRWLAGSAT